VLDLAPPADGWREDARLRIQTLAPMKKEHLLAKWNGVALAVTDDLSEPFPNPYSPLLGTPKTLAAWTVPRESLRDGANRLEVALAAGGSVEVAFIDLAAG
jgi:hypothetical protein